jgi:hypothetical protein
MRKSYSTSYQHYEVPKGKVVVRGQEGDDHGNGWLDLYDVVGNRWQRALPTHINQGPWLRSYNGVMVSHSPGLCGRLVRTATKHAPIGEFRLRFFPDKPPEDLHGAQHAPETRAHILNHCSWYVRRADHYKGGIDTIPGLIMFLMDNPTAFSFDPTEQPRIIEKDWRTYRMEVYRQRDTQNEVRKRKKLPPLTGAIFHHETVEYYQDMEDMFEGEEVFRARRRVSLFQFLSLSVSFFFVSLIRSHSSVI